MKNLISRCLFIGTLGLSLGFPPDVHAAGPLSVSPLTPPQLVVVVVIDQFRADMLTRYASEFIKPRAGHLGGFRFLMQKGAWYPFAQYQALEDMTCPGHATISTGAQPASSGITMNEWYDRETKTFQYCVADKIDGESPRHLIGTTFGDELRMAHPASRVYSVALKDRAAILMGGHNPNFALWYEYKQGLWGTSTYYAHGNLPSWVNAFNSANPTPKDFELDSADGVRSETRWTLDLALKAVTAEKLGRHPTPDVLFVSLSSHDILGHMYGPESKEVHEFTVFEDGELARFFDALKKELGSLDHVVIALTADHGGAPKVSSAQSWGLESGAIDQESLLKKLNTSLTAKFDLAPGEALLTAFKSFHFYLNDENIKKHKLNRDEIIREAKRLMLLEPGVQTVFTEIDAERGIYPVGALGEAVRHSYLLNQSGDLILIPKPFFFEKSENPSTHMTSWSYDRSVPLILEGPGIRAGIYDGAHVVDLAPTLSFMLGVLPPAMADGHVLTDIFSSK